MHLPNGWKIVHLSALSKNRISNGAFNDPKKVGSGYRLINVVNLYASRHIDVDELNFLEVTDKEFKTFQVEKGDLFFTRSSLKLEGIAHCNIFDGNEDNIIYECHIMRVRPICTKVVPKYLLEYCQSPIARKHFMSCAKTGTMTTIDQKGVGSLNVLLPPLPEQQKIAQILSIWDKGIEKLEALIAAKQNRKKGLIQQLLTGKHRFPEFAGQKWKAYKLSEFLIPTLREENKPTENYLAIGIRSHCKGTFQKPGSDPDKIAMDKLYRVKKDDLIVNITFAWEGAIALVKEEDEGGYVSHRFPTYTFNMEKALPSYFKYAITTKRFRHILDLISPGGAGRNRVLSKNDFLKIEWRMPTAEEQKIIAAVLTAADKEIETHQKQLAALKEQKKGLMQQFLSGKKRVIAEPDKKAAAGG